MHIKSLFLLQWNARSLTSKLGEFKKILDYNKPHIACITETWLRNKDIININGYEILRYDSEFGRSGGGAQWFPAPNI